ncbi:hypothetical protein [uncultured Alistipes sp.]|uniref:hypothetical protein n=1 Tax=uncultured Alistipes sp. TaxID=538949 RepID=UPI00266CA660|nr:hypothetical protein [uncultured Alistipes sp.]
MKELRLWIAAVVAAAGLASCSSAYYAASGYAGDDLYVQHDRAQIARKQQAEAEAKKAEAEARRAEWEARIAEAQAAAAENDYYEYRSADSNPYQSILADDYESAYARRLRGFESPTYRMPSSYINARYSSAFTYASAYDPAFYNVIVMGDEVWVEPKYITSMFGSWGTSVVLLDPWYYGWSWPWGPSFSIGSWGWSFGWNAWYRPWYAGWYSPWYDPWWGPGWGWGPGWHHHPYWGPAWGPGWGHGHHWAPRPNYRFGHTGTAGGSRYLPAFSSGGSRYRPALSGTRGGATGSGSSRVYYNSGGRTNNSSRIYRNNNNSRNDSWNSNRGSSGSRYTPGRTENSGSRGNNFNSGSSFGGSRGGFTGGSSGGSRGGFTGGGSGGSRGGNSYRGR